MRKWIQFSINIFPIFLAPFSIGYLFFPIQTLNLMGFQTDDTGILFLRFIGAFVASFVVLIWTTRKSVVTVRKPIILAVFILMLINFFVVLAFQASNGFGIFGYFGVFMYALGTLMTGLEYFYYMPRD